MRVVEKEVGIEEAEVFRHREMVHDAVEVGGLLFTLSPQFLCVWTRAPVSLLVEVGVKETHALACISHVETREILEHVLGQALARAKNANIFLFGPKMSLNLKKSLALEVKTETAFISHLRTRDRVLSTVRSTLRIHLDTEHVLGSFPARFGLCTKIREHGNQLLCAFESGHILRVVHSSNAIIRYDVVHFQEAAPVLDFLMQPKVVLYFGKHLEINGKKSPVGVQMKQLVDVHHLFVALSQSHLFLMNEESQILFREKRKGLCIPVNDQLFFSETEGRLVLVQIGPSI